GSQPSPPPCHDDGRLFGRPSKTTYQRNADGNLGRTSRRFDPHDFGGSVSGGEKECVGNSSVSSTSNSARTSRSVIKRTMYSARSRQEKNVSGSCRWALTMRS